MRYIIILHFGILFGFLDRCIPSCANAFPMPFHGTLQGGARAVVASPNDLPPSVIAEFSSTLTQKERGKLLKRFGAGKVKCLVCGLVAKDSSDLFLFQRDLFFWMWESLEINKRCCKKYCGLRFFEEIEIHSRGSDVVARGIDIPEVTAVVNYSAPSHLQTYIHRVGRTARAGKAWGKVEECWAS